MQLPMANHACSSESASPYCAVYGYLDDVWDGYTMILCDSTPTTYDFYYTPEGATEDDVTSFVLDDTSETGSKSTGGKSSEETGEPSDEGDDDDDDDDGGTPVGAIVGGTIGGVGMACLDFPRSSSTMLTIFKLLSASSV